MAWARAPYSSAALAGLSYALSSTGLTLINKYLFSRRSFPYPWFTLAFQNVISVLLIALLALGGLGGSARWRPALARELRVPIACFVLFIFSHAQALRYMNLPVLTVFKSLGPMGVTLVERTCFGDRFRPDVYFSMALIALSAFVTALYDLEYTALGYFWAVVNVVANVGYLAALRTFVSNRYSALDKTFHSNLLSLLPILPISLALREAPPALRALGAAPPRFWAAFALSGALTLGLCGSAFWCIAAANGSTLSFIGGLNKIPIVVLGALLFEARISPAGWAGVALGLLAGLVFVRSKARGRLPLEPPTTPGRGPRPSPRPKLRSSELCLTKLDELPPASPQQRPPAPAPQSGQLALAPETLTLARARSR